MAPTLNNVEQYTAKNHYMQPLLVKRHRHRFLQQIVTGDEK